MKRNILAIAIPALLVAGAANAAEVYNKDGNKVDIYGRVYALNYIDVGSKDNSGDGDKTSGRLGFRGETQLTDQLVGYGRFEWEIDAENDNTNGEARYAFAGFKFGDWGSFDYGRNDGVLKSVLSYTDVLPEFGGDSNGGQFARDTFVTSRSKGVATYRNAGFFGLVDGLNFAVQYRDSNYHKGTAAAAGREVYGVAAEYLISGFGFSAGYAGTSQGENAHREMSTFAAKYDANNLYVAALYSKAMHLHDAGAAGKSETYEFVAQYGIQFDNGAKLTPSIAYLQGKDKTKGVTGDDKDIFKYVEVGATYDFNKNMTAILDYKINRLKDQDDTLAVGLIYRF